jgi:hypothetical protein
LSWDPADLAAAMAAAERGPRWRVIATRVVGPALVLVAAVIAALAVAGVFGGDGNGSAGSIETEAVLPPATVHVPRRALTTPLPDREAQSPERPRKSAAAAPSPETTPAPPTSSPSATPTPPAPAPPPQTDAATRRRTRLDARARNDSESASPPFDGGAPAADEPGGFQAETTPAQP